MCVPVLLVRDGNSGASLGIDQGSDSRYQVVYGADSLLDPISIPISLLIKFYFCRWNSTAVVKDSSTRTQGSSPESPGKEKKEFSC